LVKYYQRLFIIIKDKKYMKKFKKNISKTIFASFFVLQFVVTTSFAPMVVNAEEPTVKDVQETVLEEVTDVVVLDEVQEGYIETGENSELDGFSPLASGSIKTRGENCGPTQNTNHYLVGETVWISGSGFSPGTSYDWSIKTTNGNLTIGYGSATTDQNGNICLNTFIVLTLSNVSQGPFKAEFGGKTDNFSVVSNPVNGVFNGDLKVCKVIVNADGSFVNVSDWSNFGAQTFSIDSTLGAQSLNFSFNTNGNNIVTQFNGFQAVCDEAPIEVLPQDLYVSYSEEVATNPSDWEVNYFEGDPQAGLLLNGVPMYSAYEGGNLWITTDINTGRFNPTLFLVNKFTGNVVSECTPLLPVADYNPNTFFFGTLGGSVSRVGNTVQYTFTIPQGSCYLGLHLSSYQFPAGTVVTQNGQPWDLQELFEHAPFANYAPGVYTVSVNIPACAPSQTDLYTGVLNNGVYTASYVDNPPHHNDGENPETFNWGTERWFINAFVVSSADVANDPNCGDEEPNFCPAGTTLRLLETKQILPTGAMFYSETYPEGDYLLEANGTYIYRKQTFGSNSTYYPADAAFALRAPTDVHPGFDYNVDPWRQSPAGTLAIKVNGMLPSATWGTTRSPINQYFYEAVNFPGGQFTFQITDSYYPDNTGFLTVKIWDCEDDNGTGGGTDTTTIVFPTACVAKGTENFVFLNGVSASNTLLGDATLTEGEDGNVVIAGKDEVNFNQAGGSYQVTYTFTIFGGEIIETRTIVICSDEGGGGNGGGGGGGSSGGGSSSGGRVLGTSDEGEVLGATSCVAFTTYNKRGSVGGEVKALQTFLNMYMNAGLTVDGVYGRSTTQAVHDFQAFHWNEVIDPWTPPLSPNTTGWQYKSTRATINAIIDCPEAPVYLEDPAIWYQVLEVSDDKGLTQEQIETIYNLLIEAQGGNVLGATDANTSSLDLTNPNYDLLYAGK